MLEVTNAFLDPPLREDRGVLVVPDGPGVGVGVNRKALTPHIAEQHVVIA